MLDEKSINEEEDNNDGYSNNDSRFSKMNLDDDKDFGGKKPVNIIKESDLSCLGEHESQCLTFPTFKPNEEDLAEFMSTQGNTNGGRFV